MTPSIVLIGFMGAGKSGAARILAEQLGTEPVDTDQLLEQQFGCSIDDFFAQHGEKEFRRREEALVCNLLAENASGVIALGGGGVTSARVRKALKQHIVVLLDVSLKTAWERVQRKDHRPLARDYEGFSKLYRKRSDLYMGCADVFILDGGRERFKKALPHVLKLHEMPLGSKLIWARAGRQYYPVYISDGLLAHLGSDKTFSEEFWPLPGQRYCVSDRHVAGLYANAVPARAATITIKPGESAKNLRSAEHVWRKLVKGGATRADHVVALGGGVVGDLAGFCAATYQRGMPVIQVPTTLVAQVDSAYGGKTGVDLPEAKNYVGAYHQPAAVLVDPVVLETLPAAEFASGYVEVIKTALIAGGGLWQQVRSGADPEAGLIASCAYTKLKIVAQDERDGGIRQVLNLGHTIGHAIETATGYERYRHGEAVGLGLLAALRLSGADELRVEVKELLKNRKLPVNLKGVQIDAEEIITATARDKKRVGKKTPYVLLSDPGNYKVGVKLGEDEVLAAVKELFR